MTRLHALAATTLALLAHASPAFAILTCDLDGKPVNPNNGSTIAGQTGLMRCRDADTGLVQREQESKNGVFMGMERFYTKGELAKERRVNERGNGDGPTREWTVVDGKRVLTREGVERNGSSIGLVRMWMPTGALDRLVWYGDDGRDAASVEFTKDGKLRDLRCTTRPVFGNDFDDRTACGFAGVATTPLYDAKGRVSSRVTWDQGQRRKTEVLAADTGQVRDLRETTATGRVERSFWPDGTKRLEVEFTALPKSPNASPTASPPMAKTLEQEYAESGRLIQERRWTPNDRNVELVAETTWYLNGQPKEETRVIAGPQGKVRREKSYYDSGVLSFEGDWVVTGNGDRFRSDRDDHPVGTHRSFDERGRTRGEQLYDDKGRLTRERAFDEAGGVVRDDEVFEDGSRKGVGR